MIGLTLIIGYFYFKVILRVLHAPTAESNGRNPTDICEDRQ